jgi:hypothetical protein
MTCRYDSWIDRDLLGDLTAEEREALETHWPDCPSCRSRLEAMRSLEKAIGEGLNIASQAFTSPREKILKRIEAKEREPGVREPGVREPIRTARPLRRFRWKLVFLTTNVAAALLLLLAYFGYAVVVLRMKRQARLTVARTDVRVLTITLHTYRRDLRKSPPDGIENLVRALRKSIPNRPWPSSYFTFPEERIQGGTYLDPWGRPYIYRSPNGAGEIRIFLYSLGENGLDERGGGDDISNLYWARRHS